MLNTLGRYQNFVNEVIKDEREKWTPVYDIIEEYLSKHPIFLSGVRTMIRYFNLGIDYYDWTYECYTQYALTHANNLANALYAQLDKELEGVIGYELVVSMRTIIPKEVFAVNINGRTFAVINKMKDADIIVPEMMGKLRVIPPELYMIQLYKKLAKPKQDNRLLLSIIEERVFDVLKMRIPIIERVIVGQAKKEFPPNALGPTHMSSPSRLKIDALNPTIISSDPIEKILKDYPGNYKELTLDILSDSRIKRYLINGVLNVYNTSQYDQVPVIKISNGSLEPHPLVNFRILLIEIWIIRIIANRGSLNEQTSKHLTKLLLKKYVDQRGKITVNGGRVDLEPHPMDPPLSVPPLDYVGKYVNRKFYRKRKQKKQFFSEYFPERKLRVLN